AAARAYKFALAKARAAA
nr:Chain 3m, UNK3 [Tetrahymena thermophila]